MRIAVLLFFICNLCVKEARCQSGELIVQGKTGKLYLQHTVVAKENWYSIGRLYNLSPKVIAPYNHLTLASTLNIGEQLKIPLVGGNFSQNGVKDATEALVPLYYVVGEKEWMYRVSVDHNKVSIPTLEKWNHINGAQVHAGMRLIVGYLRVKTALSAFARKGMSAVAREQASEPAKIAPANMPSRTPETNAATYTGTNTGANTATNAATNAGINTTTNAATNTTANTSGTTNKPAEATSINFNGGFFKTDFNNDGKSAEGQAGTFKSTSGWQDGKYYALMNNLPVGTIVRITSTTTRKSIYAKILGQLPDMKESAGLTIRVSNAAAGELGESDGKFNVEVKY